MHSKEMTFLCLDIECTCKGSILPHPPSGSGFYVGSGVKKPVWT